MAEDHEHGAKDEDLVGQRIEKRTRLGGSVPASQVAVETVTDTEEEPHHECDPRSVGVAWYQCKENR